MADFEIVKSQREEKQQWERVISDFHEEFEQKKRKWGGKLKSQEKTFKSLYKS